MDNNTAKTDVPHYEEFCAVLAAKFDGLSRQLKQIAQFVVDHPVDTALDTAAEIANKIGVQPSSLVRFAQALEYDGFLQIQKVFRTHLIQQLPDYSHDYPERLKTLKRQESDEGFDEPFILNVFRKANVKALESLNLDITAADLDTAIRLIKQADTVYLLGQRRSFPAASYLYYLLRNMDISASLMDGVGGMLHEQSRTIGKDDVLITITFPSYAEEVMGITRELVERGTKIISVTNTLANPVAALSDVHFFVDKITVGGFRTLSGTMCLAQALAIGVGLSGGQLLHDAFHSEEHKI